MGGITTAVDIYTKWRRITSPDQPGRSGWGGSVRAVQAGNSAAVTGDTSLNFSAVYAAVNLISDSLKTLPLFTYKRLPNGGKAPQPDHPVYRLLHGSPNPQCKPGQFKKYLEACRLLWGNGYAEIDFGPRGPGSGATPRSLWPIHPDRVQVGLSAAGDVEYRVSNNDGTQTPFEATRMFHVFGMSTNGISGLSIIALARESIGVGIAAERHGYQFYGNNAQPGTVLVHPAQLDEEAATRLRTSWQSAYGAGSDKFGVAVLEEDMKVTTLGMPHVDAQYLETRVFQVGEMARWFKVPPHKLAELSRATFSNIEHQAIEYVTDTILPIAVEWEEECNRKLFSKPEQTEHFVKFIVNGLLRGDSKSRSEFYAKMIGTGAHTINEVRGFEDMNPIGEAGDAHYVPLNMTTAEQMLEPEPEPEPEPPVVEPAELPPPPPSGEDEAMQREQWESATAIVNRVITRLRRKEVKAGRAAVKRHLAKGDDTGFGEWVDTWYAKYGDEMHAECGPSITLMHELAGRPRDEAEAMAAEECTSRVQSSRGQLHGLCRDSHDSEAADAVAGRLDKWESELTECV